MAKKKRTRTLQPNVFAKDCPSRALLNTIANRWSLLIIDALSKKARRNGELMRMIEGISQKMLTQSLRELEGIHLVARTERQTVPPHVEYALTDLGKSIRKEVCRLDRWIENHMQDMTDQ